MLKLEFYKVNFLVFGRRQYRICCYSDKIKKWLNCMCPFRAWQGEQHSIIIEYIIADGVFGFTHLHTLGKQVEVDIGDKINRDLVKFVKEDYYPFWILDFRFRLRRPILLTGSFPNFNGLRMQNVNL